jgi:hypothetical protein
MQNRECYGRAQLAMLLPEPRESIWMQELKHGRSEKNVNN